EIIETPSSAFSIVVKEALSSTGLNGYQHASRTMLCKPVEFAGPISVTSILSRMSSGASCLIKAAKQCNGLRLKFTAGNQTTTTRLAPGGKTCLGSSIASHSSQGRTKARSIAGEGAFASGGGHVAVTNPMCSPSIGRK